MTPLRTALGTICAAFCLAWAGSATALQVAPLLVEIESRGARGVGQIDVTNRMVGDLPLEVQVDRISFSAEGEAVFTAAAESDLFVFPFQVSLKSGEQQTFQVRWMGDPERVDAQMYMLRFRQLPIQTSAEASGVQVLYEMGSVVYVAPPNTRPALSIVSTRADQDRDGNPVLRVTVRNDGDRYGLLSQQGLRVKHAGGEFVFTQQDVVERAGQGAVPARGERVITLRLDQAINAPEASLTP